MKPKKEYKLYEKWNDFIGTLYLLSDSQKDKKIKIILIRTAKILEKLKDNGYAMNLTCEVSGIPCKQQPCYQDDCECYSHNIYNKLAHINFLVNSITYTKKTT